MPSRTHQRVGRVVGSGHAHIVSRHEAIANVWADDVVGIHLSLNGLAVVAQRRQRGGHRSTEVVGVDLSSSHGRIGVSGAIRVDEQLVGSWVCCVREDGRSVGSLALVVVVVSGLHKRQLVVRLHGRSELALRDNGLGRSREADRSWCLVHFVSLGDGLTLGDLVGAGGRLADWRGLLLSIALFGSSAALKILQTSLKLLACSRLLDGFQCARKEEVRFCD